MQYFRRIKHDVDVQPFLDEIASIPDAWASRWTAILSWRPVLRSQASGIEAISSRNGRTSRSCLILRKYFMVSSPSSHSGC